MKKLLIFILLISSQLYSQTKTEYSTSSGSVQGGIAFSISAPQVIPLIGFDFENRISKSFTIFASGSILIYGRSGLNSIIELSAGPRWTSSKKQIDPIFEIGLGLYKELSSNSGFIPGLNAGIDLSDPIGRNTEMIYKIKAHALVAVGHGAAIGYFGELLIGIKFDF